MSTFALDTNSSSGDIISGLNYAIANLGQSLSTATANVLVANIATGEITTTSTNSAGYTSSTLVSYLYQYMDVQYANSVTGGSGFSSNSQNKSYYGLRNTANANPISFNPVDYVWYQVSGGFGTTKSLWYQTIGGRQVQFFAGNAAPQASFISVPDQPTANSTPLNLDTVTSAQNNQIVNVNAYYQANVTPATPSGGTYNFTTFVLTPPSGWTSNIPSSGNTSVYVSTAAFTGNSNATAAPPATSWTVPTIYSSQFQGNTGPAGTRGFVPMGFVIASSDPTAYSNAALTTAYSSSRTRASPPIGLGFAPIQYDTAQFAYQDLFTGNTITIVKQYDGTGWTSVVGNVISGGLFVPGSINANTLNVNQIYTLTIASTNANVGNVQSNGFWLQSGTGDARIGGNISIGNNLTIGNNAVIGSNTTIGGNLIVGNNAVIGGNATVGGVITTGILNANVVNTTQLVQTSATQVVTGINTNPYPTINFVNGNTTIGGTGYIWPAYTRGFALGGGVTIQTTTNGSPTGSQIQVMYNAYINSSGNTAQQQSNVVELWKSGSSNYYKNTFTVTRAIYDTNDFKDYIMIPGTSGIIYAGNIGNIISFASNTTSTLYDGYNSKNQSVSAWGQNGTYVLTSPSPGGVVFSGNVVGAVTTYGSAGSAYPLFNILGVSQLPLTNVTQTWLATVMVGSGGYIAYWNGQANAHNNGSWAFQNSGIFADLNDICPDLPSNRDVTVAVNVNYVTVGTGGTLLYNTLQYDRFGNITTNAGWATASTGVTSSLNSVMNNYGTTTRGNLWVAVGNSGTILYSSSQSGPWSRANSVPTTNNLNAVGYTNGVWAAVGDNGTIISSTDGSNWTGPYANPADGSITSIGPRNLYGCAGGPSTHQFMVAGEEIILTSNSSSLSTATWANTYVGGSSLASTLTRLQFQGSYANVANVTAPPPANQQVTNAQVVSGSYTDSNYTTGQILTYYLVLGNLIGNTVITTQGPNLTITEIKR